MNDLGKLAYFLGMKILSTKKVLILHQKGMLPRYYHYKKSLN